MPPSSAYKIQKFEWCAVLKITIISKWMYAVSLFSLEWGRNSLSLFIIQSLPYSTNWQVEIFLLWCHKNVGPWMNGLLKTQINKYTHSYKRGGKRTHQEAIEAYLPWVRWWVFFFKCWRSQKLLAQLVCCIQLIKWFLISNSSNKSS